MQQIRHANIPPSPQQCAESLLDVVPLIMRTIRKLMREQGVEELSLPQFRALGFVHRHPQTSVSAVAEHLGLSVAATSRLVDALVGRQLLERHTSPSDRRFVTLHLSPHGTTVLEGARHHAAEQLALALGELTDADRVTIVSALAALRLTFAETSALAETTSHVMGRAEHHAQAPEQGSEGTA